MNKFIPFAMCVLAVLICATIVVTSHAEPVATDGVSSVRLLDSQCASETAIATLENEGAITTALRADLMIAGVFMPGCWAFDSAGDILIADRHGGSITISREAFDKGREHL